MPAKQNRPPTNNETNKGGTMNNDEAEHAKRYLARIGAKGGKATSAAKTAACRRNWRKAMAAKAKKKGPDK
jgi:topoisomerase IA-like protein